MRSSRFAQVVAVAAASMLVAPAGSTAAKKGPVPHIVTGGATHVLATSALLTAVVYPEGQEGVGYYFVYGPTTAYGSQTAVATLPAGKGAEKQVKVGLPIAGLQSGVVYHYKAVLTTIGGRVGGDHQFKTKGIGLAFSVPRTVQATYGTPFLFSAALTGLGAANHRVALQASPFPYLEAFSDVGLPAITNASGRFAFRVGNLTSNTQLRVTTLDPLPIYSKVITVEVGVRVTLHVRTSSSGLVRLYGTITPAVHGAKVLLQVQKAVRPGKSEVTNRYVSQFTVVPKRARGNAMRFSTIVKLRRSGRYRAYVRLRQGPLSSGSSNTIVLHAH